MGTLGRSAQMYSSVDGAPDRPARVHERRAGGDCGRPKDA
jgi:hypothetical protein